MKIVYVEWIDSFGGGNWMPKESANFKLAKCVSVGFLVRETKKKIIITSHECDNGDVHGAMAIPKCAITKLKRIRNV